MPCRAMLNGFIRGGVFGVREKGGGGAMGFEGKVLFFLRMGQRAGGVIPEWCWTDVFRIYPILRLYCNVFIYFYLLPLTSLLLFLFPLPLPFSSASPFRVIKCLYDYGTYPTLGFAGLLSIYLGNGDIGEVEKLLFL